MTSGAWAKVRSSAGLLGPASGCAEGLAGCSSRGPSQESQRSRIRGASTRVRPVRRLARELTPMRVESSGFLAARGRVTGGWPSRVSSDGPSPLRPCPPSVPRRRETASRTSWRSHSRLLSMASLALRPAEGSSGGGPRSGSPARRDQGPGGPVAGDSRGHWDQRT